MHDTKPCPVCLGDEFEYIEKIDFKFGDYSSSESVKTYDVLSCTCCQYVSVNTNEPDSFIATLYDKELLEEQWSSEGGSPYQEMAEFFFERTQNERINCQKVVDIGCGRGQLAEILKAYFCDRAGEVYGVDFKNNAPRSLDVREFDLSLIDDHNYTSPFDLFSIGFCSHVLEHMIDPRGMLRGLRRRAAEGALLYLEVPDHSHLNLDIALNSNLWSAQHLNYFSLLTLRRLAVSCGWKIIAEDSSIFGFIPRARLILKAESSRGATDMTILSRHKLSCLWRYMAEELCNAAKKENIAIWGVGSDFLQVSKQIPDLESFCMELYDQSEVGYDFEGVEVKDPVLLKDCNLPIYITARPANTRVNMKKVAKSWGIEHRIVDVYEQITEDMFDGW
jgi:SAM-dependent methyltransferase